MRATILAQPEELQELFRRMVFNILVRNTDDHPRNHGFLWSDNGLALSPAYDIVPTPIRPGISTEFSLCMAVGERGREASLANAMSMSPRFGLTRKKAEKVVDEMRECVCAWEKHYRDHGLSEGEIEAIRACFALTR